jgi:PAS domain S-box-containing protein
LTIYAEIIRSTGEAVAISDLDGNIIEVNPAYETAIGRSRDELLGTGLYAARAGDDSESSYRELWRGVSADGHWTGEVLDRRSNGESFPSWALINTVHDERGAPTHYVCVSRDITTYVGASIGTSFYPQDGKDAETLQMNADMAMYEAKEGGRGQCRVFSREMVGRSKDPLSLSVQIDAAFDER